LNALGQRVKEIAGHSYDLDHEQQKMIGHDRSPYTNRHLARIQKPRCRNKPNGCRMLGQLLPSTFCINHYPVVKPLQACPGNIFGTCLNMGISDRMRKATKCIVQCLHLSCRGLIWRFCMDEIVCLLLCTEGIFLWLPQDDKTMDVDTGGHVTT